MKTSCPHAEDLTWAYKNSMERYCFIILAKTNVVSHNTSFYIQDILTLSTMTVTLIPSKNTVDNGQNDDHYNKHLFQIHLLSYESSFHQEHMALNTRLNTNKTISDTKDILMVENCCPN